MINATGIPGDVMSLYQGGEAAGVVVIILGAGISLVAVIGLLITLGIASVKPSLQATRQSLFMQSSFGTYFVSLLFADIIQATGSFMNIRWVNATRITSGGFCTAQGSIKNVGNVASAVWTLVIAGHVFNLLFLRMAQKKYVALAVAIATWSFIGAVAIFGPAVLEKSGPFFGIAGYWCWITEQYPGARVGLEYFWMFFSAIMSFILYMLVFLRLRGNIIIEGWKPRFKWVPRSKAWQLQATRDAVDAHMTALARQMLWYPVGYTIVIVPIAIARFISAGDTDVPFGWTVFADTLFMLSGFINVVLFLSTRKYLPAPTVLPTFNIPRKAPPSAFIPPGAPGSIDPYYLPHGGSPTGSDKSFGSADRNDHHRPQLSISNDFNEKFEYTPDAQVLDPQMIGIRALPAAHTRSRSIGSDPHDPHATHLSNAAAHVGGRDPFEDPAHQGSQVAYALHDDAPLKNPFSDAVSPHSVYSPDDEWHSPLSAYLEEVDLSGQQEQGPVSRSPRASNGHARMSSAALASRLSTATTQSKIVPASYGGRV